MYELIKKLLFLMPAEKAHHFTMRMLTLLNSIPLLNLLLPKSRVRNGAEVMGIQFPNKVGLAAGFDKNASYLHVLSKLGFGFVEIGTVTPLPQEGNPQPRLFRLPKDEALINRMGFNNDGMEVVAERLKQYRSKHGRKLIIGGNIGKNKVTPNEEATSDYLKCYRKLYPYVDYFVVNVSSPNTPNLRALQDKEPLNQLLASLKNEEATLLEDGSMKRAIPILLKIAPDVNAHLLKDMVDLVVENKLEGIIATNTTIDRSGLNSSPSEIDSIGAGGLSGKPLGARSTELIRDIRKMAPSITIIGVGGIYSQKDAADKLEAGANLVQIYSGFIYQGPNLIGEAASA